MTYQIKMHIYIVIFTISPLILGQQKVLAPTETITVNYHVCLGVLLCIFNMGIGDYNYLLGFFSTK